MTRSAALRQTLAKIGFGEPGRLFWLPTLASASRAASPVASDTMRQRCLKTDPRLVAGELYRHDARDAGTKKSALSGRSSLCCFRCNLVANEPKLLLSGRFEPPTLGPEPSASTRLSQRPDRAKPYLTPRIPRLVLADLAAQKLPFTAATASCVAGHNPHAQAPPSVALAPIRDRRLSLLRYRHSGRHPAVASRTASRTTLRAEKSLRNLSPEVRADGVAIRTCRAEPLTVT